MGPHPNKKINRDSVSAYWVPVFQVLFSIRIKGSFISHILEIPKLSIKKAQILKLAHSLEAESEG